MTDDTVGIHIEVRPDIGHINIRGDAEDTAFREGIRVAVDCELPTTPNTVTGKDKRLYWLGPDEWLLLCDLQDTVLLRDSLEEQLANQHVAINVLSGGQLSLHLTGERVTELLSKGCTLDLDPAVFAEGSCAQSGIAKAGALIGRIGPDFRYEIVVRRSFSRYLVTWLKKAAAEYGSTVSGDINH